MAAGSRCLQVVAPLCSHMVRRARGTLDEQHGPTTSGKPSCGQKFKSHSRTQSKNPRFCTQAPNLSITSWHVLWMHQWLSLKLYEIHLEFWDSLHHSFRAALHSELGHDGACHGRDRRDREMSLVSDGDEAHPSILLRFRSHSMPQAHLVHVG